MIRPSSTSYNPDLTPGQVSFLAPIGVICGTTSATTLYLAIGEQLDHHRAEKEADQLEAIAQNSVGVNNNGYANIITEAKELRLSNPPVSEQPEYAIGVFGPLVVFAALYASFKASRLQ